MLKTPTAIVSTARTAAVANVPAALAFVRL